MDIKLDTSGVVEIAQGSTSMPTPHSTYWRWSDLSPFTQGYVEAVLRSIRKGCDYCSGRGEIGGWMGQTAESGGYDSEPCPDCVPAFSDLAAEARARIIEDCERYAEIHMGHMLSQDGAHFWTQRQAGHRGWEHWPILTVSLGDDGKVRFIDRA